MAKKKIVIYPTKKRDDVYRLWFDFGDPDLTKKLQSTKGVSQESSKKWFLDKTVDVDQLKQEFGKKFDFKKSNNPYWRRREFIMKYGLYIGILLLVLIYFFHSQVLWLGSFGVMLFCFGGPFAYRSWRALKESFFGEVKFYSMHSCFKCCRLLQSISFTNLSATIYVRRVIKRCLPIQEYIN